MKPTMRKGVFILFGLLFWLCVTQVIASGASIIEDTADGVTPAEANQSLPAEVTVHHSWTDGFDRDTRPVDEVGIVLLVDGQRFEKATLNEENGWSHTFGSIPEALLLRSLQNVFGVQREAVRGYDRYEVSPLRDGQIEIRSIFNDLTAEKADVAHGVMVWKDYDAAQRPRAIQVDLLAGSMAHEGYWDGTYAMDDAVLDTQPLAGYQSLRISPYEAENPDVLAIETRRLVYDPERGGEVAYPCWEWTLEPAADWKPEWVGENEEADTRMPYYAFAQSVAGEGYVLLDALTETTVVDGTRGDLGMPSETQPVRIHRTVHVSQSIQAAPDTLAFEGTLAWDMAGYDDRQPQQATVQLQYSFADAQAPQWQDYYAYNAQTQAFAPLSQDVSAAQGDGEDAWCWRFENLPAAYFDSTPYQYRVATQAEGFASVYDEEGNLTGTYETEQIPVALAWADGLGEQRQVEQVAVVLMRDGEPVGRAVLDGANAWRHVFRLPRAASRLAAPQYTLLAEPAAGYGEFIVKGDAESGFTLWGVLQGHTLSTGSIDWELGYFAGLFEQPRDAWPENTFACDFAYVPQSVEVLLQWRAVQAGQGADDGWIDVAGATQTLAAPDWSWQFLQLPVTDGTNTFEYRVLPAGALSAFDVQVQPESDTIRFSLKRFYPDIAKRWRGDSGREWMRGEQALAVAVTSRPQGIRALAVPALHDLSMARDSDMELEPLEYVYDLPAVTPQGEPIVYTFTQTPYLYYTPLTHGGDRITITPQAEDIGGEIPVYFDSALTVTAAALSGHIRWETQGYDEWIPQEATVRLQRRPEAAQGQQPAAWEDVPELALRASGPDWRWSAPYLPGWYDAQTRYEYRAIAGEELKAFTSEWIESGEIVNQIALVDLRVQMAWEDGFTGEQRHARQVPVTLYRDGDAITTVELDSENGWSHAFEGMPKFGAQSGEPISYTIAQVSRLPDYEPPEIAEGGDGQFIVTNRLRTLACRGEIAWETSGLDALVPDTVTLALQRRPAGGGEDDWADLPEYAQALQKSNFAGDAPWAWSFENLPASDGAQMEYEYRARLVTPLPDYEVSYAGDGRIEGILAVRPLTVRVQWDDGFAPEERALRAVDVRLAEGAFALDIPLRAEDDWSYTVSALPRYRAGTEIPAEFEVGVQDLPGYEQDVRWDEADGLLITNRLKRTSIAGVLDWNVSGYVEYIPDIATIRLQRRAVQPNQQEEEGWQSLPGTANRRVIERPGEEGKLAAWSWAFDSLPLSDGGHTAYEYRAVLEDMALPGFDVQYADGGDIVCTLATTDLTVRVRWDDGLDDEARPLQSVPVELLRDGVAMQTVSASASTQWTAHFGSLPQYAPVSGDLIDYTVQPMSLAGYAPAEITQLAGGGMEITNALLREDIAGTIQWEVGGYPQRIPQQVSLQLQRRLGGAENWENVPGEGHIVRLQGGEAPIWDWRFEGLPMSDGGEHWYSYRVVQLTQLPDFAVEYDDDHRIVNRLRMTDVSVRIGWDDGMTDAQRPVQEAEVTLLHGGTKAGQAVFSAEYGWAHTFEDLPACEIGTEQPIVYETVQQALPGYDTGDVERTAQGYGLTYRLQREDMEGQLAWTVWGYNDYIPQEAAVRLQRRAEAVQDEGAWETLEENDAVRVTSAQEDWRWAFEGLPGSNGGGEEYAYRAVLETPLAGYTTQYHDGGIIESTLQTMDVTARLAWDDDYEDGQRPVDPVLLILTADDTGVHSVEVMQETQWEHTFKQLPVYTPDMQRMIEYSVREDAIPGYALSNIELEQENLFILTNRMERIDIGVAVLWDDGLAERPVGEQEAVLLRDGQEVARITLRAQEDWHGVFEGVRRYEPRSRQPVDYTLQAATLPGYEPAAVQALDEGFAITNSLTTRQLAGQIEWITFGHVEHIPSGVAVRVQRRAAASGQDADAGWEPMPGDANRRVIERLGAAGKQEPWTWTFDGLPTSDGGNIWYEYRAAIESGLPDYTVEYQEDDTIAATLATRSLAVEIAWDDDYTDETRPVGQVELTLLDGQRDMGELTVEAATDWRAVAERLPRYVAGTNEPIEYTVREAKLPQYEEGEAKPAGEEGVRVLNRLLREGVTGRAIWQVGRYEAYIPQSMQLQLQRRHAREGQGAQEGWEDVPSATQTISAPTWRWTFRDLPVMADDVTRYEYRAWLPQSLPGLDATVDPSGNLINSLITRRLEVRIAWQDEGWASMRPDGGVDIVVNASTGDTYPGVLFGGANWTMVYPALPVYDTLGGTIEYTVEDTTPTGYIQTEKTQPGGAGDTWQAVIVNALDAVDIHVRHFLAGDDALDTPDVVLLLKNGEQTIATQALSSATGWDHTFAGLPRYGRDGLSSNYTVTVQIPANYHATVERTMHADGGASYVFTSRRMHEATGLDALFVPPDMPGDTQGRGGLSGMGIVGLQAPVQGGRVLPAFPGEEARQAKNLQIVYITDSQFAPLSAVESLNLGDCID